MTPTGPRQAHTLQRVLLIGTAVAVMGVAVVTLLPRLTHEERPMEDSVPRLETGAPIPEEAGVFRIRPADLALDRDAVRRPAVHPRTLAMFRALRAYPGAPPRIPHGLTAEEHRATECVACHERGGYVERFASYAPVTPHPELTDCLQCHLPRDAVVGVRFPDRRPNAVCFQCHVLEESRPVSVAIDWPEPRWPAIGQAALPGAPPSIPHDLQLRGNCLACHMAPGGVEEIRTTHPERSDCRQCHLPNAQQGSPARPEAPSALDTGTGS